MTDYTESIPADLPQHPHNGEALREEVTIKDLTTGTGVDLIYIAQWGMAMGKFEDSLSQPPERPAQFVDLSVEEVGNVTIKQCSKEELLVLLTWYGHETGNLIDGAFDKNEESKKVNKTDAKVITQCIESVDENFLDELPDDYSKVGQIPASIAKAITDANYAEKINLGSSLNVNAAFIAFESENAIFNLDDFAGLFYCPDSESIEDEVMIVLFGSGDAICFANNKRDIEHANTLMSEKLSSLGLI